MFGGLYVLSRYNYPLFHSFADTATAFIASGIFVIVWSSRRTLDNHYYLFAAIAFLFFAFFDFLHMLGNEGMGVFPQYGNLGPTLYIASRYILSISLVLAPLYIKRKVKVKTVFAAYTVLTILLVLSIFYWRNFPVTYIEGVGLTHFKTISDYIICVILLGAAGLLLVERREFAPKVLKLIIYSIVLSIATGLSFTLYTDPYGIMNAVGHFFQIGSFCLVYLAFIDTALTRPQDILYRNLRHSKDEVSDLNARLAQINLDLRQDVAERQMTEEALQRSSAIIEAANSELKHQKEELERSNRELEQFAYVASHDLQEPLRMVASYVQLLAKRYQGKLDKDADDFIYYASDGAKRMQNLINDLLTYSRVSTRGEKFMPVSSEIILEQALENLQIKIQETGAVVTHDPLPVIKADSVQIVQVFQNLIGNGIKFHNDAIPRIQVSSDLIGGEYVFSVRDNGIGIAPEFFNRVFMIFQRLHTREEYEGTGIGLAVCKRIVERHHGRIWVESQPEVGSTFYFTIPAKETGLSQPG